MTVWILPPRMASPTADAIAANHAARPQNERPDRFLVADFSSAQPFDRDDEYLLHQVLRRGCVAKMFESVEPYAWGETAIEFRLLALRGAGLRRGNRAGEHRIVGSDQVRRVHTLDRTNRISLRSRWAWRRP